MNLNVLRISWMRAHHLCIIIGVLKKQLLSCLTIGRLERFGPVLIHWFLGRFKLNISLYYF